MQWDGKKVNSANTVMMENVFHLFPSFGSPGNQACNKPDHDGSGRADHLAPWPRHLLLLLLPLLLLVPLLFVVVVVGHLLTPLKASCHLVKAPSLKILPPLLRCQNRKQHNLNVESLNLKMMKCIISTKMNIRPILSETVFPFPVDSFFDILDILFLTNKVFL